MLNFRERTILIFPLFLNMGKDFYTIHKVIKHPLAFFYKAQMIAKSLQKERRISKLFRVGLNANDRCVVLLLKSMFT